MYSKVMGSESYHEESIISSEVDFAVSRMTIVELEALLTLKKAKKKRQTSRVEVLKDLLAQEVMKLNRIERELVRVESELCRRNHRKAYRSNDTSRESYSESDVNEEAVCLRGKPSNYDEIGPNQASLLGDYEMWPCSRSNQKLILPSPPNQDYGGLLSLSVSGECKQDSKEYRDLIIKDAGLSEREVSRSIEPSLLSKSKVPKSENLEKYDAYFHENVYLDYRSDPQTDWERFMLRFSPDLASANENENDDEIISDRKEEKNKDFSQTNQAEEEEPINLIDVRSFSQDQKFENPLESPLKASLNDQAVNHVFPLRRELFEPLLPSEVNSNMESYPLSEMSSSRSYELSSTPDEYRSYYQPSRRSSDPYFIEKERLQEEKCHDLSDEFLASRSASPKPDLNFLDEDLWDDGSCDEGRSDPESI